MSLQDRSPDNKTRTHLAPLVSPTGGTNAEAEYAARRKPKPPVKRGVPFLNAAEEQRFNQYFLDNQAAIQKLAQRMGVDGEDVSQDTFENLLSRFRGGEPPSRSYGLKAGYHASVDQIRRRESLERNGFVGSLEVQLEAQGDSVFPRVSPNAVSEPEAHVLHTELASQTHVRLPKRRQALQLALQGYSREEIAEKLGQSPSNAGMTISRGRDDAEENTRKYLDSK